MSFLVLNTFEAGFMADFCFLLVFKASQFACEIRSFPMYAMSVSYTHLTLPTKA